MIVLVKSVDCKNLKFLKDKLDKQTIQWLSFVCGDRNEMKRILTKKKTTWPYYYEWVLVSTN